jgi:hypothetical protein
MWTDLVDRTETLKRNPAGLASSRGEFDLAPDKGAGCAHLLPVLFETLRRQRIDNPLIHQCRPHRFCDRDAAPVRHREALAGRRLHHHPAVQAIYQLGAQLTQARHFSRDVISLGVFIWADRPRLPMAVDVEIGKAGGVVGVE